MSCISPCNAKGMTCNAKGMKSSSKIYDPYAKQAKMAAAYTTNNYKKNQIEFNTKELLGHNKL